MSTQVSWQVAVEFYARKLNTSNSEAHEQLRQITPEWQKVDMDFLIEASDEAIVDEYLNYISQRMVK
jgi:hypothetical protein